MIEKLVHTILRSSIQGGFSNEIFTEEYIRDSRLTHHIPTMAVMKWKNCKTAGKDSKFTDISGKEYCAEGKTINPKTGTNFKPSVDTGSGRKNNKQNIDKCFEKNSFYFLYETTIITDTHITFEIYWIPVNLIKEWFKKYGTKSGTICYSKLKSCISQCEIELTE